MPRLSYFSGQSNDKEILRLFPRGSRYMAIMCGAIAVLIWAVGPSFPRLWIKNEKVSQIFPALIVVAAGALVWLSHRLSTELLYSLEKQKKLAVFSVVEGISVFGLSLALSYKYGMTGVAIGASVLLILVPGIIQTAYVCRLLKVSFWKYYPDDFFGSWVIAVILAVASYWLEVWNITKNWPSLFLTSASILLICGSAIYLLAPGRAEKQHVRGYVLGTFRRIHVGYLSGERDAL
jgi:O-antigen/teichoic acid export membrane protein